MKVILCLSIWLLGYIATLSEALKTVVEPEHLNKLLEEQKYEEFSKLFHIDNPDLVRPKEEDKERSPEEAMFDQGLPTGDILIPSQELEEDRQGMNFDRFTTSRWPDGIVPYEIAASYDRFQRRKLLSGIRMWNKRVECVKFRQRTPEDIDYIFIFPGSGCWSFFGRTGGSQVLSLSPSGCLHDQVVIHELQHSIGFAHEHNRCDRDNHVRVLWNNIPERWKRQYTKTNITEFDLLGTYDFYSNMHYPITAPGTNLPAFQIRTPGIDERRIGKATTFTEKDLEKIEDLYC